MAAAGTRVSHVLAALDGVRAARGAACAARSNTLQHPVVEAQLREWQRAAAPAAPAAPAVALACLALAILALAFLALALPLEPRGRSRPIADPRPCFRARTVKSEDLPRTTPVRPWPPRRSCDC